MFGPTKDHTVIRAWAEKHDAVPAEIMSRKFDSEPALLHFLFGKEQRGLPEIQPISWESFFAQFDLMNLSMMYDESPMFELVHDDRERMHRTKASIA